MTSELLNHTQMHKKYKELSDKHFVYPYFYELTKNNNTLYFIGAKHSNEPNKDQFKLIKEHWKTFVEQTKDKRRLAVIEGGPTPYSESEEKAILEYGEPGFVVFLADKEKINFTSPEPPSGFETSHLLERYGRDEVVVYHFANIVSQWQRFNITRLSFDDYVSRHLSFYFYHLAWPDFDFSPANLKKLYKKVTGRDFDEKDDKFIYEFITPTDTNISGLSSNIRDEFILNEIKEYWNENSLFIVYGSGHAIRLEKALRNYSDQSIASSE